MTDVVLLYVTVPESSVANKISNCLLQEGLAACTNLSGPMHSNYHWQGRLESATEWVLLVKTTAAFQERATNRIVSLHPYEVPCVLSLPVLTGHGPYLNWLRGSVG